MFNHSLLCFVIIPLCASAPNSGRVKRYSFSTDANLGDWPWQLLLVTGPKDYDFCGGSLISNQWVLTAAHCVDIEVEDPMSIKIFAGIVKKDDPKGVPLSISEIHSHPKYEMIGYSKDMALIKLKTPVQFSKNVKPACLNLSPINMSRLQCVGTGWGQDGESGPMPNHLQMLPMNVSDLEDCKKIHKEFHEFERVNDNHICMIGDKSIETNLGTRRGGGCNGDSGGPLVCKIDSTWRQIGVTWSGADCEREPTVYNLVDRYAEWILKTSGYKKPEGC